MQKLKNVGSALADFEDFLTGLSETASGDFAVGKDTFDELLKEVHFLHYNAESLLEKRKGACQVYS